MADHAAFYNSLPSILEADKKFTNRDHIFSKLSPLLATYENKFGVCLVHRHCSLEEGEKMVATGNVCQPERDVECYPDHWLATGEPYEFNRNPSLPPPQELMEEFRKIIDGVGVLGLFSIQDESSSGVLLERTEGRKNIVEFVAHDNSRKAITTGWLLAHSDSSPRLVYSCTQCKMSGGQHLYNSEKMEELEKRSNIGHEISW